MDKIDEKPLGMKEAVELTGYCRGYIYQLIHARKIPYHTPAGLKGKVFFKKSELPDFIYHNKKSADYEMSATADAILNGERKG
jgi:excisionase family DNA binding protein